MMMTSYEAPGYGAGAATPGTAGYFDPYQQHQQYAWQFACTGLQGYQRLQQQHQYHLQQQQQQQQQKFDEQFDQRQRAHQQLSSQPAAVGVGQHYYGNYYRS